MKLKPICTEKSLRDAAFKRYTFAVSPLVSKDTLKRDISKRFGLKVLKISTIVVHGKSKRVGKKRTIKHYSSWKKVIVTTDKEIALFSTTEDKK
jgi:ribosomal protein L23